MAVTKESYEKWKKERELIKAKMILQSPTVDQNYIKSYSDNVSKFISGTSDRYSNVKWGQSQAALNSYNNEATRLKYQKVLIEDWLSKNAEAGSYDDLLSAMTANEKSIAQIGNEFSKLHNSMSKYGSADEYNTAVTKSRFADSSYDEILSEITRLGEEQKKQTAEEAAETQKTRDVLNGLLYSTAYKDRDSYTKAIADLDRQIKAAEIELSTEINRSNANVNFDQKNTPTKKTKTDKEKALEEKLNAIKGKKVELQRAQNSWQKQAEKRAFGTTQDIPEFGEYSKKGSTAFTVDISGSLNDTVTSYNAERQKEGFNDQNMVALYWALVEKYPELLKDGVSVKDIEKMPLGTEHYLDRFISDAKSGYNIPIKDENGNLKEVVPVQISAMDETQRNIYNYLYAMNGIDTANKYLATISGDLNAVKAKQEFEDYDGKTLKELLFAVESGLDQWEQGFLSFLSGNNDTYVSPSVKQNLSALVKNDLGTFGNFAYDMINTTSNMLPSILMSSAAQAITGSQTVGQIVGAGMIGASASGNAYIEMVNQGYSQEQAKTYANLVGASEAGLSFLLSGISKLGGKMTGLGITKLASKFDTAWGKFAVKLGGSMASEGFEEYLQEVISPLIRNYVFYTDEEVDLLSPDALYAALLGALSGGMFEGVSSYQSAKRDVYVKELINTGLNTNVNSESFKLANELADISVEEVTAEQIDELTGKIKDASKTERKRLFNRIKNDLVNNGETGDINKIANIAVDFMTGVRITEAEAKLLNSSKFNLANRNIPQSDTAADGDNNGNSTQGVDSGIEDDYIDSGTPESVFPNVSAQGPEPDFIKDFIYREMKVDRLTDEQIFIRDVGKAIGREVKFGDLDMWVTDENGKSKRVHPNGYYDKNTGIIYINSSKKATVNALQFIFKHELTHFAESDPAAYFDFANGVMDSQAFKAWVKSKGFADDDKTSATMAMNEDYVKRYTESSLPGTENFGEENANREMVADFVAENLFVNDMSRLKNALTHVTPEATGKFKQLILNLLNKLKNVFSKQKNRFVDIQHIENEFVKVCDSAQKAWEQKNTPKNEKSTAEGGKEYSFKGYAEDGKGKYESNFPKGTPKAAKAERILQYIQNVWSKKPIRLKITENGETRYIEARFDPTYTAEEGKHTDASKLMGGNRHGTASEQRVTLDLADDYYQIASESQYNYSKDETGKDNPTHKDVIKWHYFINDIYFAEHGSKDYEPYRVSINVKERTDGDYVYSFSAEKQRESNTPQTLHAVVNDGENPNANVQLSDNRVAQNEPSVNSNSTQKSKDYSESGQYSVGLTDTEELDTMAVADELISKYGESTKSKKTIADELDDIFYSMVNSQYSDGYATAQSIAESFNGADVAKVTNEIYDKVAKAHEKAVKYASERVANDRAGASADENQQLKDKLGRANERIKTLESEKATEKRTSKGQRNNENPISIARLKPKDANTTPPAERLEGVNNGNAKSNFYESMQGSSIFDDRFKADLKDDSYVKSYRSISNKETLRKAVKKLEEGGQSYVDEWFSKGPDEANLIDITVGILLMDRYQRVGDRNSAIAVAEKVRQMGTASGQQVQIFSIIGRFDPDTMAAYAQKELSKAYEIMIIGKSNKWIEANKEKFELTADEIETIRRKTLQAALMPDESRPKTVLLAEICTLLQNKIPPETGQSIRAWQRICMLLNVKTNLRNIFGNVGMVPVYIASDYWGSGIDKLIAKKTGVRTTGMSGVIGNVFTKSGREHLAKGAKGFGKGLYETFDDFKRGIHTKQEELNRYAVEGFGMVKNEGGLFKHRVVRADGITSGGKNFNENTQYKAINAIARKLNALDNLTSFCLELGDRPFFEMWFMNSLNNQLRLNGITDSTEATADMIDIATEEALQRTWQDENRMSRMVSKLKQAGNQIHFIGTYGIGDLMLKFTKTPANISKAIVDFSPIGLFGAAKKAHDLAKAIKASQFTPQMQKDLVRTISNAMTGTFFYALVIAGASLGFVKLTGAGDEDKDVSNYEKYIAGIPPYSIEIFGVNVTYDWFQPFGSTLAIATEYIENKNDPTTSWEQDFWDAFTTAGEVFTQQSFLNSLNQFFQNADNNVLVGLASVLLSDPSVNIPTLFSQVGSFFDEKRRTTYDPTSDWMSMLYKIGAKLPGIRMLLPEQVDALGEDVENNQYLDPWRAFASPYNDYPESSGKVAEEIYELYKSTGDKTVMPRVAPNSITVKGRKYSFNAEQKSEYQRETGKASAEMLEKLFDSAEYQKLTDEEKAKVTKKIYDYSTKLAKIKVVSEDYDYQLLSDMIGEKANGDPILTEQQYNKLSEEARVFIIEEYLLSKAELKFKTHDDAVEYYIKRVQE